MQSIYLKFTSLFLLNYSKFLIRERNNKSLTNYFHALFGPYYVGETILHAVKSNLYSIQLKKNLECGMNEKSMSISNEGCYC